MPPPPVPEPPEQPPEPRTPLDLVLETLFGTWWGSLLAALAFFALAWLVWPGPPKNPDDARAFKANVRQFLLSAAAGLCGLGMLWVVWQNLFVKDEAKPPPPPGDGAA